MKKILFVVIVIAITIMNIILFKNFYNNKIEDNNIQIKRENTNF